MELEGSPDMVLEVVSPTSVEKDTVLLPSLYHKAGVREYWLVNPLGDEPEFTIHRFLPKKYTLIRPDGDGWVRSPIFQRSFRLAKEDTEFDFSEFTLEMR